MILTPIAIYDIATGEIKSTGGVQFDADFKADQIAAALAPWGVGTHGMFEGDEFGESEISPETQYVVVMDRKPVLANRPELVVFTEGDKTTLLADGEDSITLTGLPDPCEIIIDDPDPDVETAVLTVSGGGFVFVADDPGVYSVEVRRWPFLPFLIELTAI